MNKHYIRLDENKNIVYGFSDAFEQPQDGDTCINEKGGRHFKLDFTEENPPFLNMQGVCLYKYAGSQAVAKTPEELQVEISNLPEPRPTAVQLLEQAVTELEIRDINKDISITDLEIQVYELLSK